jgi:hypothetical protein
MRSLLLVLALSLMLAALPGMTIGGAFVTVPSDATGERPIADALLIGR